MDKAAILKKVPKENRGVASKALDDLTLMLAEIESFDLTRAFSFHDAGRLSFDRDEAFGKGSVLSYDLTQVVGKYAFKKAQEQEQLFLTCMVDLEELFGSMSLEKETDSREWKDFGYPQAVMEERVLKQPLVWQLDGPNGSLEVGSAKKVAKAAKKALPKL